MLLSAVFHNKSDTQSSGKLHQDNYIMNDISIRGGYEMK